MRWRSDCKEMTLACRVPSAAVAALALLAAAPSSARALTEVPGGTPAPSSATAAGGGGSQAPSSQRAGGSEYGVQVQPARQRPLVSKLSVPRTASPGSPPQVRFEIVETGVRTVSVQVSVISIVTHRIAVSASLGWVHTGRTLAVRWPRGAALVPGSYQVSLSARDHVGSTLLRGAHSSTVASLVVAAPIVPVAETPTPTPSASAEAGVPTPAQTLADGAVFPVAGLHSFGGPENRFGAPRAGHIHEGQDVLAAEGTPDLAPLAGTVLTTSYQAGGAGYYMVEHSSVGFDLMFAHCEAASFLVSAGQAVSAGQELCKLGQTGDATAPHLHFEMWVGGWQASTGHPIDPLPYLEAWEHASAGG
jgi:biotin carboxyl carrier protein